MAKESATDKPQTPGMSADKLARRAIALRNNLQKRKAQQKARNDSKEK
ncbi:MAG: hypothetical protein AB7G06_06600 [Bdellovibrionales bacterium]